MDPAAFFGGASARRAQPAQKAVKESFSAKKTEPAPVKLANTVTKKASFTSYVLQWIKL